MPSLSALDRKILTLIQANFPVQRRPYAAIAQVCGCTEPEALEAVNRLREKEIRRLGGVFDLAHLGYVSTLCALAEEDPAKIEQTAAVVSSYPEVTHNYQREDRYNIWFTVIAYGQERIDAILSDIAQRTGVDDILDLPAQNLFKIKVDFNLTDNQSREVQPKGSQETEDVCSTEGKLSSHPTKEKPSAHEERVTPSSNKVNHALANPRAVAKAAPRLSEAEKALVRVLQGNISQGELPFDEVADQLSQAGFTLSVDEVIDRIKRWIADGTIRRFGACVRHQRLGYAFNAMTVWDIPDADIEKAGAIMADDPRVTHCYERLRKPTWPSNAYTMIHGTHQEDCFAAADDIYHALIKAGIATSKPRLLFSTREFKKRSMRYFCEEEMR